MKGYRDGGPDGGLAGRARRRESRWRRGIPAGVGGAGVQMSLQERGWRGPRAGPLAVSPHAGLGDSLIRYESPDDVEDMETGAWDTDDPEGPGAAGLLSQTPSSEGLGPHGDPETRDALQRAYSVGPWPPDSPFT